MSHTKVTTLLLISCLLNFYEVKSQDWAPIGATWYYKQENHFFPPTVGYSKMEVTGDTIVNGQNARIISGVSIISGSYPTITYADSGKVYLYDVQRQNFALVYDFNANANDSWTVKLYDDSFTVTVNSVTVLNFNGIPLRVQDISIDNPLIFSEDRIYENIGGYQYLFPFSALVDPYPGPIRCYEDSLLGLIHFSQEDCDTTYYLPWNSVNERNIQTEYVLFPNPTDDKFTIELNEMKGSSFTVQLTGIDGKRVMVIENYKGEEINATALNSGMYVVALLNEKGIAIQRRLLKK